MSASADDPETDQERKDRIWSEIVVDAYNPEEQALSWYYYLEEQLTFPFKARCVHERSVSPLREDETVRGTGLPDEETCMHEMFVPTERDDRTVGVSLSQLDGIVLDAEAQQANADWKYERPLTTVCPVVSARKSLASLIMIDGSFRHCFFFMSPWGTRIRNPSSTRSPQPPSVAILSTGR